MFQKNLFDAEFFHPKSPVWIVILIGIAICSILALLLPKLALWRAPTAILAPSLFSAATTTPDVQPIQYQYLEVIDGCNPYYVGTCVNMRAGPGVDYPVVERLRTGVVLRVDGVVNRDGQDWYKIAFVHALRYPERVKSDWYVIAGAVDLFNDDGDHTYVKGESANTTKRIVVDISEEMLYAYDGDVLFMKEPISTGLEFTPTPRGTFKVLSMTPSRYMQGPIPGVSEQVYDLPGVPWNLYFTKDGAVIHGAYWHDHFGQPWSHGCVNLPPQKAKELYKWAVVGLPVTVQE